MPMTQQAQLSLLWPPNYAASTGTQPLDPQAARDLELNQTIKALCLDSQDEPDIARLVGQLCSDPAVLTYRQDVLADLLTHASLYDGLLALMPIINALVRYQHGGQGRQNPLQKVTWRLGELENVVEAVQQLRAMLQALPQPPQAEAWRNLQAAVEAMAADELFQRLEAELPSLLETVRGTTSITIGINLDQNLQPMAATLLSLNDQPFTEATLLSRLFGGLASEWDTVAPLHHRPKAEPGMPNPMLAPLFRDLAALLEDVCYPVERALRQYNKLTGGTLARLRLDFTFYLGAARLVRDLQAQGFPFCRPEIRPVAERLGEVEDNFNLNLALQQQPEALPPGRPVVKNDLLLGEAGRIVILTGPNGGGKTTYLQAIGLTQVLAQAGLFVPGRAARLSPVDHIFTHYPGEEELARGTGRFGDEAKRLSDIFARMTGHSLLLLNESLASTHAGESLYIAQDIVRVLRRLGARAVFATHLHALAAAAEELNAETEGASRVISLVASRLEPDALASGSATQRSYRVVPGPPMGRSYARELAERYGISYKQLQGRLSDRGLLDGDGTSAGDRDDK